MNEDLKWLMGTAVTLMTFFGGSLFMAFRTLSTAIRAGDDQLHERVNRVRDEYAKRVDLDDHIKQLRDNLKELRDESREGTKETNKRLDQVLAVLAQDKK